MHLQLLTSPALEPVTLEQARAHLRLDAVGSPPTHPDDALVTALIVAARQRIENETGRALIAQQWEMVADGFAADEKGRIALPRQPVLSVDQVRYVDSDGVTQTFGLESPVTSWRLIGKDGAILVPGYNIAWPSARAQDDAVRIAFTAGYGEEAADVPAPLKAAMLLDIGLMYENRESVVVGTISSELPMGWEALVWPYRRPVAG